MVYWNHPHTQNKFVEFFLLINTNRDIYKNLHWSNACSLEHIFTRLDLDSLFLRVVSHSILLEKMLIVWWSGSLLSKVIGLAINSNRCECVWTDTLTKNAIIIRQHNAGRVDVQCHYSNNSAAYVWLNSLSIKRQ